jgi:hypothetical protein
MFKIFFSNPRDHVPRLTPAPLPGHAFFLPHDLDMRGHNSGWKSLHVSWDVEGHIWHGILAGAGPGTAQKQAHF